MRLKSKRNFPMAGHPWLSSMHRQVLLLATAQALFQTTSVLVMTVGGLAGGLIAPSPQLATAPIAAMFLGTAVATFPASLWMARVGRRRGFVTGALLGATGGACAVASNRTCRWIELSQGCPAMGDLSYF